MKKLFLIMALVFALIPAFFVYHEAGGAQGWKGVIPEGITDSLYYYARIHEVADGHPLIGNPYILEYQNSFSPAFFIPDVIAAAPLLIGLPFNLAMLFNVFLWGFIFLWLCFNLLSLLKIPKWWALAITTFVFIGSYSFMLRPVAMQIVYPAFILFLMVLLQFLYEPLNKKRVVWLSVVSALAFYIYTYLAYIVLIASIFIFFWYLLKKRFKDLLSIVKSGFLTSILLIPFGVYTILQLKSANYFEILTRLGLVHTHIPSIEAFFYGRWVVVGLIVLGLIFKFFFNKDNDENAKQIFWFSTGLGLLVGLFLNVITGAELTLAIHIGRFVLLWMALVLGVSLYGLYLSFSSIRNNKAKYIIITIFVIILGGGVARNLSRGLVFFEFTRLGENIAVHQAYEAPLKWLNDNVSEESVIWTNDSVSHYVPILSKHYPLFAPEAQLHNSTDKELEDRYLLSRSLITLKVDDIKKDFVLFTGLGPNVEQPLAINREVWFCNLQKRLFKDKLCSVNTDAIKLRGEEYFSEMTKRFNDIKKNRLKYVKEFNVKYFVLDRAHDNFTNIPKGKVVYDDGRFEILELLL